MDETSSLCTLGTVDNEHLLNSVLLPIPLTHNTLVFTEIIPGRYEDTLQTRTDPEVHGLVTQCHV